MNKKVCIVIPAYQPEQSMVNFVQALLKDTTIDILIVNDGSDPERAQIFKQLATMSAVKILSHSQNRGKGRALKTAFQYIGEQRPNDYLGVITADCDGQHCPDDVFSIKTKLLDTPEAMILGVREFGTKVPWRSRLGNIVTSKLFQLFFGKKLADTQTGLRAIPTHLLLTLLEIKADGYDFEFDMLVQMMKQKVKIEELRIKTIYIDNNRSSHFNPLTDSIRVYFVFLRFLTLSMVTSLVDFCVFMMSFTMGASIMSSTYAGRLVAGAFNFYCGKKYTFRSTGSLIKELVKYASLVFVLANLTYFAITFLVNYFGLSVYLSKILSESLLFVLSFVLQRKIVFKSFSAKPLNTVTDWNAYYAKPTKASTFTRRLTEKRLVGLINRYNYTQSLSSLCELGGANSCFYDGLRSCYPEVQYIVVDNNALGLSKLKQRVRSKDKVTLIQDDILSLHEAKYLSDVVFSVGLIEHFSPKKTAQAIQSHFIQAKENALVIITFPTPTLLYRLVRKLAELTNQWIFHDERPLSVDSVIQEASRYGDVVDSFINWGVILTQGVIAVRARNVGHIAREIPVGEV